MTIKHISYFPLHIYTDLGPNTGTWFVRNEHSETAAVTVTHDTFPSSSSSSSSSSLRPPVSSTSSVPALQSNSSPPTPGLHPLSFSHWFLRTAWSQVQLLKKTSLKGITHPFEYEQRAFHYLLDTEVWRDRGLERYDTVRDGVR